MENTSPPPAIEGPAAPASVLWRLRKPLIWLVAGLGLWLVMVRIGPHYLLPQAEVPAPDAYHAPEKPAIPSSEARPDTEVKTLDQRLAALEQRWEASGQDTDKKELSSEVALRLEALEEKIAAANTASQNAPIAHDLLRQLSARVQQQEDALSGLQSRLDEQQDGWRFASLLQSYYSVEAQANSGQPFASALRDMQALAVDMPQLHEVIAALLPAAEKGLPSLVVLQTEFEKAVPLALHPASVKPSLAGNLRSLITIRKTGDVEGTDAQAVIARAETRLKQAEVEAALKELEGMPKQSRQAFTSWQASAKALLEGRAKLAALKQAIVTPVESDSAVLEVQPYATSSDSVTVH